MLMLNDYCFRGKFFFSVRNPIKDGNKKNQMHITNEWNKIFMIFPTKLELAS